MSMHFDRKPEDEQGSTEPEHFGALLRRERESRSLTLDQVATVTKLSQFTLQSLEDADFDSLPPEVFVRGFAKAYARAIGTSDIEPLAALDRMLLDRRRKQEETTGLPLAPDGELVPLDALSHEDVLAPKRGVGLAIFVVIVLVIATITVSYLMRQPPAPGEGLSQVTPVDQPVSVDPDNRNG